MSSARAPRRRLSGPAGPSPRVSARDPYALGALVLIACIATFIAAAFDWQGVVLPANFRVDAWITPPAYTGKPPIILAGIHPGEPAGSTTQERLKNNQQLAWPLATRAICFSMKRPAVPSIREGRPREGDGENRTCPRDFHRAS